MLSDKNDRSMPVADILNDYAELEFKKCNAKLIAIENDNPPKVTVGDHPLDGAPVGRHEFHQRFGSNYECEA